MVKVDLDGWELGADLQRSDAGDAFGDGAGDAVGDGLARSTSQLRAICEKAPTTLPRINLDLSEEEEEQIGAQALAALRRLQALWAD
jgi:hypothetical protein